MPNTFDDFINAVMGASRLSASRTPRMERDVAENAEDHGAAEERICYAFE